MATASVKLIGADFLKQELKAFPAKVQERAIQTGLRKGAGILTTQLRRSAYAGPPKSPRYKFTRTLRKALRSAVGKKGGPNAGKAWVGLKRIKGETKARNYYRVLEVGRRPYQRSAGRTTSLFGRVLRALKRSGAVSAPRYEGSPPMRPFFAQAWAAKRTEVGQAIVTATRVALAREAGRAYARSLAVKR